MFEAVRQSSFQNTIELKNFVGWKSEHLMRLVGVSAAVLEKSMQLNGLTLISEWYCTFCMAISGKHATIPTRVRARTALSAKQICLAEYAL